MSGRRQSDRPKKLPSRFVGWNGLRMVTASREKTLKPALTTTAGRGDNKNAAPAADHRSAVPPDERVDNDNQNVTAPVDNQNAVPPDDQIAVPQGECIDDSHHIAVPPDQHMNDSDECMYDDPSIH